MRNKRLLELALTALFLLLASAALWLTDADRLIISLVPRDLAIAAMQSDSSRAWPVGNLFPWRQLYSWASAPALLLAAAALSVLLASFFTSKLARQRRKAAFIILFLALGPGLTVNLLLKEQIGRARPREIVEFGGSHQFTQFWQPGEAGANSSFPSGHAAIAFAVMAPWFVLRDEETKTAAGFLAAGLLFGILVGIARILQGGHFASDILWAGGLLYLIGGLLAVLMDLTKEPGASALQAEPDRIPKTDSEVRRETMKTSVRAACGGLVLLLTLLAGENGCAADSVDPSDKLIRFMRTEHTPSQPLLPPGTVVKEGFEPGEGAPVGTAQIIKGTVLVLRKDSAAAFRLQRDLPVFAGDTLITEQDSRVTLLMQDNSVLSLTAQSKLVIDQAALKPERGRDTKLKLLLGRVRAVVSKLAGKSTFTVRTPTLLAGVRGTDFAVAVAPAPDAPSQLLTAVLTGGGQSFVELLSPAGGESTVLCPLSVAGADESGKISRPVRVCWKAPKTLRRIAPEIGLNCGLYLRRPQQPLRTE